VVSVAPILAVEGMKALLTAPVVGVSPIIGGAPVRGMADKCLATVGVECSAAGVGRLYGARADGGLLDGWLVDPADEGTEVPGVAVRAHDLWMRDTPSTAAIVRAALEVAGA
jgi:LPPG:FO 2-phospho-L-lactate transferase